MSTTRRMDPPARSAKVSAEILDRQPPVNLEAEQGVLGSIMLKPDVLDDVALILRPDDFYDEANCKLFKHLLGMYEDGRKFDVTLLVERLKSTGDFDAVGGTSFLEKTFNSVANSAHARYYAEIVRDKSTCRSLINASTEILRDAYSESADANELLGFSEQKIFSIQDKRETGTVSTMNQLMEDAIERLDARLRGDDPGNCVDTGFADVDELLTGFHKSQLIVLAARPGMGKTALAMNFAENISMKFGEPVLYMSLEMSTVELADRMLCSIAQVDSHKLRKWSPLSEKERQRMVEKAAEMSSAPLFVDDTPGRRVVEIAAAARRIKRQEGRLGLVVIDYLQLIEPDNPRAPRQEQVAKMTRRLKLLARDIQIPILCLAQLNRQAEEGRVTRPRLSHLRESGAIEQDADVVMFIHRSEVDQENSEGRADVEGEAELIVAKQRNGPMGSVKLTWRKQFTRFDDRALPYQEDFDGFNQSGSF